jgi:hypothetical protein
MLPDRSLQVREFAPIVEKQPINVHYQKYLADSFSTSSVTFNVDSPFAGALLDNELLVKYTVQVTPANVTEISGMFEGQVAVVGNAAGNLGANADLAASTPGALFPLNRLGLSQGFSVSSCLQSVNLTINGQTLTQSPRKWMGEFMRFYASPHEEATVCSMSGGELDSGDHSQRVLDDAGAVNDAATTAVVQQPYFAAVQTGYQESRTIAAAGSETLNLRTQFPVDGKQWYNPGLTRRFHKLARACRAQGAAANAASASGATRYVDNPTFTIYERLPLSPFLLWEAKDGRHSIPYVDKLEIDLRFVSVGEQLALAFQGTMNNPPIVNIVAAQPELHLKWYIPPQGMVMQPQISIPVQKIKEYSSVIPTNTTFIPDADHFSASATTTFSNIRLQQIPDLFFMYAKPALSQHRLRDPAEMHLEIEELRVTVNGDSGKVLQADSGRLFSLYIKNAPMAREREYDYDSWRRRYCTAVLTPADLGVLMPPGVNHGVTLDVEAKMRTHWNFDRVGRRGTDNAENNANPGRQYEFHILSVYDKYELTLTNRGNAQLKLLNVPSPAVAQGIAQPDAADLTQAFA